MNTPMTPQDIERELQRQQMAEQREHTQSTDHDNSSIDQYRFIDRVLKQASIPALPKNFASQVARQVQDFEERAQFENYALGVLIITAVIAGLFFALPLLLKVVQNFALTINLPWPALSAVALALGFAVMI
ncbi:MAG: hypothetical protein ACREO2_07085, partial [Arenimonas sp.]